MVGSHEEQRAAVGRRLSNQLGTYDATRPRTVLDDEIGAELRAQLTSKIARKQIGRSTGWEGHNDAHLLDRILRTNERALGCQSDRYEEHHYQWFHILSSINLLNLFDASTTRITTRDHLAE